MRHRTWFAFRHLLLALQKSLFCLFETAIKPKYLISTNYAAQIQQYGADDDSLQPPRTRAHARHVSYLFFQDFDHRSGNVQQNQLEGQSFMQWPEFGGYLNFVTDDRNCFYVRFYIGQSVMVLLRIDTHCRHILLGAFDTLHYFNLNMGDGHQRANWLQLWGMPKEMQYMETFSGFSISIIQCCLEMMFCRAFESLPDQTLAEYFGTALYGQYAGTGLNVLSPLLQPADCFSLESSRAQHRSRLSGSLDPEVARSKRQNDCQRAPRRVCDIEDLTGEHYSLRQIDSGATSRSRCTAL
jgi:hypothetical protein